MTLRQQLRQSGERRLVWLEGDEPECIARTESWLWGEIFWLGEGPACHGPLPAAKALRRLGQECDTLVFNAFSGFHPDAFGALAGTLRAGGLLILLSPPRERWPAFADPDRLRLVADPIDLPRCGRGFVQRLAALLPGDPALDLQPAPAGDPWLPLGDQHRYTADQAAAIAAIRQVLRGHRKRPLVLSADRGRGKSSALGLAARALLDEDPSLRIGVTAPARATVDPLFAHAEADPRLSFFSPDHLLDEPRELDLLLVDEAAAIPAALLEGLLGHYHRIVFATTEHGYEGTGRGFHLRFKRTLERRTPCWRELHMDDPVRWSRRDPLEPLVHRLLALDATPAEPTLSTAPAWRRISATALAGDEPLLNQVFGLLVLAHYQTKPSDLRTLLEAPDLDIHLLESGSSLLGVALVAHEGPIEGELAQAIWAGRRRPRGQLLPQSLLAHAGFRSAGERRYARIMRIAIHPVLHRRGLGHTLLGALRAHYHAEGFDYLGTAFSAGEDLLPFWRAAGFSTVRIGLQRDAASGSHAVLMLNPLWEGVATELNEWQRRFLLTLPAQLAGELRAMAPSQLAWCLPEHVNVPALEPWECDELTCFAHHHKPFELCQEALQRWLLIHAGELHRWPPEQQALLIGAIWQYTPWETLARRHRLAGKPALLTRLRQIIAMRLA